MKKAVIVTGASSGIGAATAEIFSENGYFIFLLGRNEDRLQQVALRCRNGSSLLKADLAKAESLSKYSQHLSTRKDVQIEVLINNAGQFQIEDFASGSLETWKTQFAVNLFGAVAWTQACLPFLLKSGRGSIVNVSSTLGAKPITGTSAYSASKAAMNNWTQAMALELGPKGIRVNAVSAGIVDTPIHGFHALPDGEKKAVLDNMGKLQPLGRIGSVQDIAKAIYFLASPDSAWTTGANLHVDGGINLT